MNNVNKLPSPAGIWLSCRHRLDVGFSLGGVFKFACLTQQVVDVTSEMLWWWIWYLLTPSLWYWLQVRQAVARKATHHQICKIKRTSQVRRTRKMSTLHSRTWSLRRLSPLPPQAAITGVTKRGRTKTDTGTPSNTQCVVMGFDLSFFICSFRVEGLTLYKAGQGVFSLTQYKTFH